MFLRPSSLKDDVNHDKGFYDELLYIIGLEEKEVDGRILFKRCPEVRRNRGSFLESAIDLLHDGGKMEMLEKPRGESYEEQLFNVAQELTLTWIVRIIFLKFLEDWLLSCHQGDRSYAFVHLGKIKDYKDLDNLFFHVLSRRQDERKKDIKPIFENIPYLNSSLFQPTDLERRTIFIADLMENAVCPLFESSVLKPDRGGRPAARLETLEYLFRFLDAYDFDLVGLDRISGKKKPWVQPAIMDRLFRGIVGMDDKSFFVSGANAAEGNRETIRAAVVQKFNEEKGWRCVGLGSLNDKIVDRVEANDIINRLDISSFIGSSNHRMVLALNELVVIKNKLNIIQGPDGRWLKGYQMEAIGETLLVTGGNGKILSYHPDDMESQLVQEALFYEKKALIQNCLLGEGVDPGAVMICRLRLWLELLKSAYYKRSSGDSANFSPVCYAGEPGLRREFRFSRELESLPELDIKSGH